MKRSVRVGDQNDGDPPYRRRRTRAETGGVFRNVEQTALEAFGDGFRNGMYHVTIGAEVRDFVGNRMNQNGDQANGDPGDVFAGDVLVQLPDLVAEGPTASAGSVTLGGTIEIHWVVRNVGPVTAAGTWDDRIYLSTDATLSGDDDAMPEIETARRLLVRMKLAKPSRDVRTLVEF